MTQVAPTPAAEPLVAVTLLNHYVPMGSHEIVGYHQQRIVAKDAGGREIVKQEAAFIPGAMHPPPHPGVGYPNKIWARTVVKLPREEARRLLELKKAERGLDD